MEQRAESREHGAESVGIEHGAEGKGQRAWGREHGAWSREHGVEGMG